jgi:plastocyanin
VLAGREGGTAGLDAYKFHPKTLRLPAGKVVTLKVVYGAGPPHTFTVDALDCDTGFLAAGDVAFVSFRVPKGTTEFYCAPHKGGGMYGEIIGVKN